MPLRSQKDWAFVVGERNFKKGYSAHSAYLRYKDPKEDLPEPLRSTLNGCHVLSLRHLKPSFIAAEHATFLDSLKTPSKTDVMVFANNLDGDKVVIAIEAKCSESFASRVRTWAITPDEPKQRSQKRLFSEPETLNPRKIRRLEFLNSVLGTHISPESELRYQLLHRTTAAVLEARHIGAKAAVVTVHAFVQSLENYMDYADYTHFLGLGFPKKNQVLGPYFAAINPQIPLYFLYLQDSIPLASQTLF